MPNTLSPELAARCRAIEDGDVQGEPLLARDYVWFAVATIIVPVLLVIVGVAL
jgi:hypothetical protein